MATQITVGNKTTSIPGVYSTVRSGIINPPSAVDYGNTVIIDDGTFGLSNYIAINGIEGENKQDLDSALEFNEFAEITPYIWDSELLPIIKSLYKPSNIAGINGINKLTILQASETTAATTTLTFAKGSLDLKTTFEGESLNGGFATKTFDVDPDDNSIVPLTTELSKGLAVRLENGRAFGYSLVFYRGVHDRAEDTLNPGYGYNEKLLPDISSNIQNTYNITKPQPLFRSPDLKTLSDLKRWLSRSNDFKRWFSVTSFTIPDTSDDLIVAADIANNHTDLLPYKAFAGGTTTFTPQAYSKAIDLVKELDNSFFLSLQSGDDATGINNTALSNLLKSGELNWEKFQIVAAYDNSDSFIGDLNSSQYVANYYDSSKTIVVHGAAKVSNVEYPNGYRNISQLEKAAKVLGRIAGLTPQTPITWKDISINAEVHKLSEGEKEVALQNGILCTFYDSELTNFVVLAGINSLTNNEFLINEDGQSFEISIERIKSQLNKELIFGAKRAFFGKNSGPNRATVSEQDLLTWTKGFLESKVATTDRDNLLIRVDKISTRIEQDNIYVNYGVVVNTPINKIIFSGFMLSN